MFNPFKKVHTEQSLAYYTHSEIRRINRMVYFGFACILCLGALGAFLGYATVHIMDRLDIQTRSSQLSTDMIYIRIDRDYEDTGYYISDLQEQIDVIPVMDIPVPPIYSRDTPLGQLLESELSRYPDIVQ